jgi:hypothetical protein
MVKRVYVLGVRSYVSPYSGSWYLKRARDVNKEGQLRQG